MNRISREELYIGIAHLVSKRATCGRLQVGCIITQDSRIVSSGYNGPLPHEDECEGHKGCDLSQACQRSVHAEANAIYFAAKAGVCLGGAGITMYCTHSPCMKCAEAIIQSGIRDLVYQEEYRDTKCLWRLKSAGVKILNYDSPLSIIIQRT